MVHMGETHLDCLRIDTSVVTIHPALGNKLFRLVVACRITVNLVRVVHDKRARRNEVTVYLSVLRGLAREAETSRNVDATSLKPQCFDVFDTVGVKRVRIFVTVNFLHCRKRLVLHLGICGKFRSEPCQERAHAHTRTNDGSRKAELVLRGKTHAVCANEITELRRSLVSLFDAFVKLFREILAVTGLSITKNLSVLFSVIELIHSLRNSKEIVNGTKSVLSSQNKLLCKGNEWDVVVERRADSTLAENEQLNLCDPSRKSLVVLCTVKHLRTVTNCSGPEVVAEIFRFSRLGGLSKQVYISEETIRDEVVVAIEWFVRQ